MAILLNNYFCWPLFLNLVRYFSNMEQQSLLKITNISKTFGDTVAVKELSYEIFPRDFVSILGPSGCGKTTLLKMIGGFVEPTSGTIEIDNIDITNIGPEKRPTNRFVRIGAFTSRSTISRSKRPWDRLHQ